MVRWCASSCVACKCVCAGYMCLDRIVHDQQLAAALHHRCLLLPVRHCAVPVPRLACTRLVVQPSFVVLTMLSQLGTACLGPWTGFGAGAGAGAGLAWSLESRSRALGGVRKTAGERAFASRSSRSVTERANQTLPRRDVALTWVMRSEGQHASAVLHRKKYQFALELPRRDPVSQQGSPIGAENTILTCVIEPDEEQPIARWDVGVRVAVCSGSSRPCWKGGSFEAL